MNIGMIKTHFIHVYVILFESTCILAAAQTLSASNDSALRIMSKLNTE